MGYRCKIWSDVVFFRITGIFSSDISMIVGEATGFGEAIFCQLSTCDFYLFFRNNIIYVSDFLAPGSEIAINGHADLYRGGS